MGRSKGDRELTAQRRATAWELYCQSVPQNQIAAQLGISESATSKLIRQAAAVAAEALPQSREELAAELAERWASTEREIRAEVAHQRIHGRVTTTITTLPDGGQRVEQQHTPGVDPGLLRCLSTHTDRRSRQAMGQLAPVDGGNPIEAVRVFLTQPAASGAEWDALGWGTTGGKVTAEQWNNQQDALAGARA